MPSKVGLRERRGSVGDKVKEREDDLTLHIHLALADLLNEQNKSRKAQGRKEKHIENVLDFQDHFIPKFEIKNTKALELVGGAAKPRIKKTKAGSGGGKGHFITLTQKYRA